MRRFKRWYWRKIHELHVWSDAKVYENPAMTRLTKALSDRDNEAYLEALKEVKELFGAESPVVIRSETLKSFMDGE